MKKKIVGLFLIVSATIPATAQQVLCLDSCRAMALRNNKQLSISRLKQDVAANLRRSARTKYLPHISAIGTYTHTNKEISLLNDGQKERLANLGTNVATGMQGSLQGMQTSMGQVGNLLASMGVPAQTIEQMMGNMGQQLQGTVGNVTTMLNTEGQNLVDAFRTDTRNIWTGSVLAIQPVFMGGSIVALNRLADLNERLVSNSADVCRQAVIYATDQAYWQVVSLKNKQRLAESYLKLLQKLDSDVQKMIEEGIATRSEGLSVSVKVSEAEMALQKVGDGLTLSKMLLCQTIGLPTNEPIQLADEDAENLRKATPVQHLAMKDAVENRPEVKMLATTVDMAHQATNILKAGNLPQVALTGGYVVSNPSVLNGYEKKFGGLWNVGVLVRVPLWNWGDVAYKVRAAKGAQAIANLELEEVKEKIELQVNQTAFHADEAIKRIEMAEASMKRADENLRIANLGFREGVISPSVVMEAQTAWLQAQSQHIDAQIDLSLSQVDLQKAQGTLGVDE